MRDKWYGDNGDLVKWGSIVQLARQNNIETVLQIAFYGSGTTKPDSGCESSRAYLSSTRYGRVEFPWEVLKHFQEVPKDLSGPLLNDIKRLAPATDCHIDVFLEPFEKTTNSQSRPLDGTSYVHNASRWIVDSRNGSLIVLLDPDTGIEPETSRPTYEHVTQREIKFVSDVLEPGDLLVLYQHGPRVPTREPSWRANRRRALATALNITESDLDQWNCDVIREGVELLAVEKNS